nr:uncharacterized protein LOC115842942 isoform X1 [Globicephala melas]
MPPTPHSPSPPSPPPGPGHSLPRAAQAGVRAQHHRWGQAAAPGPANPLSRESLHAGPPGPGQHSGDPHPHHESRGSAGPCLAAAQHQTSPTASAQALPSLPATQLGLRHACPLPGASLPTGATPQLPRVLGGAGVRGAALLRSRSRCSWRPGGQRLGTTLRILLSLGGCEPPTQVPAAPRPSTPGRHPGGTGHLTADGPGTGRGSGRAGAAHLRKTGEHRGQGASHRQEGVNSPRYQHMAPQPWPTLTCSRALPRPPWAQRAPSRPRGAPCRAPSPPRTLCSPRQKRRSDCPTACSHPRAPAHADQGLHREHSTL